MAPIIAIIGRPNVGKSTLFNRLTHSNDALVADQPGLTRDRNYGEARLDDFVYRVVDTGGVDEGGGIRAMITQQALLAAEQADAVIFLVDGREGLNGADEAIAQQLRRLTKPVQLAVNKTEGLDNDMVCADFFSLGLSTPLAIATAHKHGLRALIEGVMAMLPEPQPLDELTRQQAGIRFSIIGRPNVGKSTLVNRMLGEERVLVFDEPGTTRDSISIPFQRDGKPYTIIDTAGVRRRSKVSGVIEKFSVIKTLKTMDYSNVVILMIDGTESVTDQDSALLGMALESGRALVIAINKWDGLDPSQRQQIRWAVDRKLRFVEYARVHYISALHGSGVGKLFSSINKAYGSAVADIPTAALTRLLEMAVASHPPPLVRGRRIKLRYAHAGGTNPPRIVIHGNQTEAVPVSYRRYLENQFRAEFGLQGTPIKIEFRQGDNPYKGKRNVLNKRQIAKRKRLMKRVKGRK